jgi:hypothetical protein
MAVHITRILKVSTSPAGIKYKFGIQVPKGINNKIDLDKNDGDQLWQEAIKTELKQPNDYQTFMILHSGEDIPTGYQKIPYHMVFDVKYDLRRKARLFAGGDWTVNDKEDIYSGVVGMDNVRIGFSQESCMDFDVVHVTSEMLSYIEKKRKPIFITACPEFGANLHGTHLIIDKFLYGLQTSAARFHEHLSELLLRLGFKQTKHDPDLWMVDKSSHYEYLATYVDEILMVVIKALEKTYMLKSVGIPEYYLGGNMEFLGGISISSISKDLHSKLHSEI